MDTGIRAGPMSYDIAPDGKRLLIIDGGGAQGFPASAAVVIPANGVVVFAPA